MKLFLIGVYLSFSFGPCWAAGAGAPPGLNTQAGSPVNVPKKADDIDGRKKLYVGRVLAQVNQVYPADFFANLTPQDKDALTAAGSKIEGNKLVMPASPLAGYVVSLGNQTEFVDKNGFFSFDTIPDGISEGQILAQLTDTKPFARFPVTMLIKNGGDDIAPIVLHVEGDVDRILDSMDK